MPPESFPPQALTEPSALSAANDSKVEKMAVYPASVGAPVPPEALEPQAEIEPSAPNAAKARDVVNTALYPLPVGAPAPPEPISPQAVIEPSAFKAANAFRFACLPPCCGLCHSNSGCGEGGGGTGPVHASSSCTVTPRPPLANAWHSSIICLAVVPSSSPGSGVQSSEFIRAN